MKLARGPLRNPAISRRDLVGDLLHRQTEIFTGPRPARRIDARRSIEAIDFETGIISKRRQTRPFGGCDGLEPRIAFECRLSLLGLGKPKLTCRNGIETVRLNELVYFPDLAGVVTRNDEPRTFREPHHATPQMRGSANSRQLPAGSRK